MIDKQQLQDSCLFCDPSVHNQAHQILLRSNNFFLFAGLGPMIEGYIIIAPDRCDAPALQLNSLSRIPSYLLDEMVFLRSLISEFYRDCYHQEASMHFEHGRAGVCYPRPHDTKHCYHAHLCCYPRSFPLWEDFMPGIELIEIGDMTDLADAVHDNPYLFVQSSVIDTTKPYGSGIREEWVSRVAVIKPDNQIPSQYLRRLLAQRLNMPGEWDWGVSKQESLVHKNIEDFLKWLKTTTKYDLQEDGDGHISLDYLKSVEKSNQMGNNDVALDFYHTWGAKLQHNAIGRFLAALPEQVETENGKKVSKPPRVLDIGCGPGHYTKAFYSLGLECVGIDVSDEMIRIANHTLATIVPESAILNAPSFPRLERMSLFDLGNDFGVFDGIWYSAVVVHIPRQELSANLTRLSQILKSEGVLYLSAQIGRGTVVRREGRVFFYYEEEELKRMLDEAGFSIIDQWDNKVERSVRGGKEKFWKHFLLKKTKLSDLGEWRILEKIQTWASNVEQDNVMLSIGDDCAAVQVPPGDSIVLTTDPCPKPVISLLGENDLWYEGWFTMLISLSDLAAMGAKPLGILLALEAPNDMPLDDLKRFYNGVMDASKAYQCPVIGGNVKDAPRFTCVGTAIGNVHPRKMLRRDAAKPGDLVIVLGDMGKFWAGVIHKLRSVLLTPEDSASLLQPLRRPHPKIIEGYTLTEHELAQCAMDNSDGLISCFYQLAKSSKVDFYLDLSSVEIDPLVQYIADQIRIDVRKLLLSWGNWELVVTVPEPNCDKVLKLMADLNCPVHVVGKVQMGQGQVWLLEGMTFRRLTYIASERFSQYSYFSHGLESYLQFMQEQFLTS